MKEKILGIMIPLGHDKYVLSDVIIAVEPLSKRTHVSTDIYGNKLRSRVLVNHAEGELLASRTAETILKSMTKQDDNLNQFGQSIGKLRKEFPHGILLDSDNPLEQLDKGTLAEKNLIEVILLESATVQEAIEKLPFGETKYYKLIDQYNIDAKFYLEFDPDMFEDQHDDGLV